MLVYLFTRCVPHEGIHQVMVFCISTKKWANLLTTDFNTDLLVHILYNMSQVIKLDMVWHDDDWMTTRVVKQHLLEVWAYS